MSKFRKLMTVGGLAATLALVTVVGTLAPSGASSHREAPLITQDPVADNTDTYAFVSPDKPDTVTLVANWIPLEEPAGGPNFHNFGDDVLYKLNVDNDGDAEDDIVYEFRFTTKIQNRNTFLYNTGPISSLTGPRLQHPPVLLGGPGRERRPHGARRRAARAAGQHRPPLDPRLRALASAAVDGLSDGARSSPGRATTRSSSTSARSSTWPACGRSTPPT